ncbi:MAG: AAA family ATPase [Candidatus Poribacteria bacterium]|nr:AAA family ATPase [Candidatus Poribacteria bacterium]
MSNQTENKKIPTPEEIQKEFEDFVKQKYGGTVRFVTPHAKPSAGTAPDESESAPKKSFDLKFDMKPKEVKHYLDRSIIKQDEAKKAIAIAVCDHYNHVRECHENPKIADTDYSKQNIVILGPTGVGKTYLIRHIAKLIGVPFVKADATRFSETGYVGANVDDMIRDLVTQADEDIELAQYGIVYLDEADKIATPPNIIGRDVSGRGVQIGLLKLMEETEVDLRAGYDVASQLQAVMEFQQKGKVEKQVINTRHILFIISGAFTGLTDIIKKRMNPSGMGFHAPVKSQAEEEDYFPYVTPQDFIEFGFEPEFIGRLPIHVVCQDLSVDDLYNILKDSEGSIIRQYERAFKAYGIEVLFSDRGLRRIAEKAQMQKTGARALMTVCERTLREYKFELPSSGVHEFVVTERVVDEPLGELKKIMTDAAYNRQLVMRERIHQYERSFSAKHDMRIQFDDEAAKLICQRAIDGGKTPQDICDELLQRYQHGLNLIKQNTGQAEFILTREVVEEPDAVLERWIRESYSKKSGGESLASETD